MPDSDSQWLMHRVSFRYQMIIIKAKVQIVVGAGVSGERQPGGYLSHELSGAINADGELNWGKASIALKQMVHVEMCLHVKW